MGSTHADDAPATWPDQYPAAGYRVTAVPIYQASGKDLVMGDDFIHLTGRCMCGAVEVSTAAPFVGALYCHCKRCQRRSGTTRSMTALCPPGAFSVTAGEDNVRVWDPGDGWIKAFFPERLGASDPL